MTALATALSGCQSNASFAVERRVPAPLALPEVARVGVIAFVGTGGDDLAKLLAKRLTQDSAFRPIDLDPGGAGGREAPHAALATQGDDAQLAKVAQGFGPDAAIVAGDITTLDVSKTLESATLVTKRTPEGRPIDVPTTRKLKTGRLQVSYRVILADGHVRRGRGATADVRSERIEDPIPQLTTLEPKDLPTQQDPIPTDQQMIARLIEQAASSIARDVVPRREPAIVTWENAGGVDSVALKLFSERDYMGSHDDLRALLNGKALSVHERACILYDAGLCEDALGDYLLADRHLDEALALENSELHQATLRDLRHRAEILRQEERR
jgi:hypothetical protein